LDAHVTADATEQWIRLSLRDDVAFDLAAIAAKVPDCGYQLRRIEVEAEGRLEEAAFVFASNGLRVTLDEAAAVRGVGRVTGSFEAPIGDPPQFTVEAFEATPAR
jgi:hypothetical protein